MTPNRLFAATRKGLLTFERAEGGAWRLAREAFVGVHASNAMVDPRTGALWCALDHGHWGVKLHRSADGVTWEERPAPAFPAGATVTRPTFPGGPPPEPPQPASVSYLWTLAPGGADQPGRLYCGTVPGGLFVSDDDGQSWSLNAGLWDHPSRGQWFGGGFDFPGVHSIEVDPRDSRRVRVAISTAGLFESSDGCQTWTPKNRGLFAQYLPDPYPEVGHDIHRLVACPAAPDVLWHQNHSGIYRSADAGGQWESLAQPGSVPYFGFAIACDAADPLTAWVVPADADERRVAVDRRLFVCRTTDGGKTWTQHSTGLPQRDCYDFAYRHGLERSGGSLALGTAGGALYVSDDRGESWLTLADRLPPVYAVVWG